MSGGPRLHYLDNLRAFVIILVEALRFSGRSRPIDPKGRHALGERRQLVSAGVFLAVLAPDRA